MKKFFNAHDNIISEMLTGFLEAFGKDYRKTPNYNGIVWKHSSERVTIVTGGGSGGEPWCIGACGEGMADAVAVGNVFAAPAATIIDALCREVYHEKGILLITGNHTGDRLNFELGRELFLLENKCDCRLVLVSDEMTSAPASERACRRSLTGMQLVIYAASAASNSGLNIDEVERIAIKANRHISSISATLELSSNPITGKSMGNIAKDEAHIGMGVTGEPGIEKVKYTGEHALTIRLIEYLCADLNLGEGDEVLLQVSGFGGVSPLESLIVTGSALEALKQRGINVFSVDLCDKVKIQTTCSVAISLMKLDDELKQFIGSRAISPIMYKY